MIVIKYKFYIIKFSIIRYEVLLIGPLLYTNDSNRNHSLSEKVLEAIDAKILVLS